MTPIERFAADRKRAADARDPWAGLCVFSTVDANGAPQARVLVLRDVGDRFGIFVNSTSPKCRELAVSSRASVLTYFASLGVQYRLDATVAPIDATTIAAAWRLRPPIPKAMDWIYTNHHPQSAAMPSREVLVELERTVAAKLGANPQAPPTAIGYTLDIAAIERLELATDVVHDRRRYTRAPGGWRETVLVP